MYEYYLLNSLISRSIFDNDTDGKKYLFRQVSIVDDTHRDFKMFHPFKSGFRFEVSSKYFFGTRAHLSLKNSVPVSFEPEPAPNTQNTL